MPGISMKVDGFRAVAGVLEPEEISNGPLPVLMHDFRVPGAEVGKFAVLRHDWQWEGFGFKPRTIEYNPGSPNAALPETIHLNPYEVNDDFVELTEPMQRFQFELLRRAYPGASDDLLRSFWRAITVNSVAFTDKHSIDYGTRFAGGDVTKNYADYILGENLSNPIPIAWKALSTGGNLVRIISGTIIEAIDFTKPLPDVDEVWAKPWLVHWATEATNQKLDLRQMVDGVMRTCWRVSPFPQMRPAGVPFPIWGRGGRNRVLEVTRLLRVENGAPFSPYTP